MLLSLTRNVWHNCRLLVIPLLMSASAALPDPANSSEPAGKPATAPYGSWRSPITTRMLVEGTLRFGDVLAKIRNKH